MDWDEDNLAVPMSQVAVRTSGRTVEHDFDQDTNTGNEVENELQGTQPDEEGDDQLGALQPSHVAPSVGRNGADGGFQMLPWAASCQNTQQPSESRPLPKHSKTFNDPVHGHMRMDPHFVQFIDSAPFQRLRYLNQLGCSHYVFPGASHTRFEHSLGVCHKAFEYADRIWSMQGSGGDGSVRMRKRDMLSVGLAGLCHDLGHGPFSHVWDHEFLRKKGITNWTHEEMSCKIVDYIRDSCHIDSISDDESKLVQQLIRGQRSKWAPDQAFLFDIVANNRNSIDVDKADYLQRDAMHCGVLVSCDFNRLMLYSKVIDNEICFKMSEYHNVMELFHSRSIMHRRVYTHKKAKAIELMVVDALLEADAVLNFSAGMYQPDTFIDLDDTLLRQIETYQRCYPHLVADGLDAPLKAGKAIIDRLRNREIYQYVNEVVIPREVAGSWRPPTSADICSYWTANGEVALDPSQVSISVNRINWAMKDKNPLDHVKWFNKFDDVACQKLRAEHMGSIMTSHFEEVTLRVYSKVRDNRIAVALNTALERYSRKTFGGKAELATPCRHGLTANENGKGTKRQQPTDFAGLGLSAGHVRATIQQVANNDAEGNDLAAAVSNALADYNHDEQQLKRRRSLYEDFDKAGGAPDL